MLLLTMLFSCTRTPVPPEVPASPAMTDATETVTTETVATAGVTDPDLRALLEDHWAHTMDAYPTWATMLGDTQHNHRITDGTLDAIQARADARRAFLQRAERLNGTLSEADALTRDLLILDLQQDIATEVCHFEYWAVSPRNNPLVDWSYLPELHVVETPADGQDLLARYRAIPDSIDNEISLLRLGMGQGQVANRTSLEKVAQQMADALAQPIEDSPLYAPILAEHAAWDPAAQAQLRQDLQQALVDGIWPALQRYRDVVVNELIPAARGPDAVGLHALPDGRQCYAALVRDYTTLDRSPEALHQAGLDALEQIHAEFSEIGMRALGTEDRAEIFSRLRTDPALYFETAEQVEEKAAEALDRAAAVMPEAFGRLPQAPCVIRRVPDHEAPYTTIAYYRQPNPDGSKPGEYFVNVYAPETRPRHEAEVLAFHESIPGHHLQIAISQELPALPAFRRYGGQTAFVEGWALYTERLADELGLYSGDLDRLGMLSFDAWRASRLVVDTGIHHMGWTRQQAEDFMRQNTPLADNNIVNEVDRYINSPGQALAYKVGQMTLWRLRREAEAALGEDFDLAAFHDIVLGAGAIPLPILEARVAAWVRHMNP